MSTARQALDPPAPSDAGTTSSAVTGPGPVPWPIAEPLSRARPRGVEVGVRLVVVPRELRNRWSRVRDEVAVTAHTIGSQVGVARLRTTWTWSTGYVGTHLGKV